MASSEDKNDKIDEAAKVSCCFKLFCCPCWLISRCLKKQKQAKIDQGLEWLVTMHSELKESSEIFENP